MRFMTLGASLALTLVLVIAHTAVSATSSPTVSKKQGGAARQDASTGVSSSAVVFKAPEALPVGRSMRAVSPQYRTLQPIVGGTVSTQGKWPFAVALAYRNPEGTLTQYCAGSLISQDAVLTAAHCNVSTGSFAIVGRHNLRTEKGRMIPIVSVIAHPRSGEGAFQNDIAILRLAEPVRDFAPVKLATAATVVPEGRPVTAIGWGATREGGSTSLLLREVTLPVANQAECSARYVNVYPILDSMLCCIEPGKDACQGDSGGPLLMAQPDGQVVQVGITSFGKGCARPDFHGVYTRVASFQSWIADVLEP
ncbi:serine protease [Corallococcus silvisoli]|uniref:serine protease n=1 Tax=Corallococcus silvisoli TaxID=2697031 RepID=UPI0013790FB0|nr:serine protease [Corallococcus silvisoli]NBD13857.1 trypsin-like serine protease [Corallococcus silvisoli]